MFIKRINKISAPHPNPTPTNPHPQSLTLKVSSITLDPNGRHILLYCHKTDTIYLTSILNILTHIQQFNQYYSNTHKYSFPSQLPIDLRIQNPRISQNILQIKISQCINGTQFIVVAYFCGICDMYSIVTGKKIDMIDIGEKCLNRGSGGEYGDGSKMGRVGRQGGVEKRGGQAEMEGRVCSQIYNVNVIGHSLFISLYNGKLVCYEGRQLGTCYKYNDQWVRICYQPQPQHQPQHQHQPQQKTSKHKKVPLYQDINNNLKQGAKTIVSSSITNNKRQDKKSQSYLQYIKLQQEKISLLHNTINIKYYLSLCQNYLVCRKEEILREDKGEGREGRNGQGNGEGKEGDEQSQFVIVSPFYYEIRVRKDKWALIQGIRFGSLPVINHFCHYTLNSINQKMGVSPSNSHDELMVCSIGNYSVTPTLHFKQDQQTISILKLLRHSYKQGWQIQVIAKITDIKRNVIQLQWIGPTMMLYLEEEGNLYYVQMGDELINANTNTNNNINNNTNNNTNTSSKLQGNK